MRMGEKLDFCSPGFFKNMMPKGCNASFIGQWETNLGRMIIKRGGGYFREVTGTYSKNNGTFTASLSGQMGEALVGDWKDDTGAGRLQLELRPEMTFSNRGEHSSEKSATFTGDWSRRTNGGFSNVEIKGRCLQ